MRSEDYCELFERELETNGDDALKYCELCELQRMNEKIVSKLTNVDFEEVKNTLKK
jgi:hypothetical protein